jgi:hypothetical protein
LEESRQLICPDSPLADQSGLRVLPLGELEEASDEEVKQLLPGLARIYGIHLGHVEGGVYRDTRNLGRTYFAVAADPPSVDLPGHQSLHHGGRGQNVLFEAGNVRFLTSSKPYPQADDIYVNDLGVMTAGAHRDDSVVGFGSATPLLNVNYSH